MKNFKSAFTMIELVFVIVVLGILAGVAIPRLAVTRDDATLTKLMADINAIKSGISVKRGEEMLTGKATWPDPGANFSNVVNGGVKITNNGRNGWQSVKNETDKTTAKLCVAGSCADLTYYRKADGAKSAGTFECTGTLCSSLE
ncbi:type II secretion system protein [Campylobacter corcagiensis]|uniref:Type II secretion system protein n=1 Tax=Campylobacter corcagiensis TaxID=1448857 RepID=A0A7M1LE96_9BACT|nr:type II secretion system protein [Campylobacter corcagiensis]QKF64965.1 putative type II secretion system protein [Campylobacter corcagiensis]QOQ86878.1 type II secretion system protein [Campylobacter corcagiensis]